MSDEKEYVQLVKYKINRDIIAKCIEEDRDINNKDVETELHQILKENGIPYKNSLDENWRMIAKGLSEYNLFVVVNVLKEDEEKAKKILGEFTDDTDNSDSTDNDYNLETSSIRRKRFVKYFVLTFYLIVFILIILALLFANG